MPKIKDPDKHKRKPNGNSHPGLKNPGNEHQLTLNYVSKMYVSCKRTLFYIKNDGFLFDSKKLEPER